MYIFGWRPQDNKALSSTIDLYAKLIYLIDLVLRVLRVILLLAPSYLLQNGELDLHGFRNDTGIARDG